MLSDGLGVGVSIEQNCLPAGGCRVGVALEEESHDCHGHTGHCHCWAQPRPNDACLIAQALEPAHGPGQTLALCLATGQWNAYCQLLARGAQSHAQCDATLQHEVESNKHFKFSVYPKFA
jgi:hypothetical protein